MCGRNGENSFYAGCLGGQKVFEGWQLVLWSLEEEEGTILHGLHDQTQWNAHTQTKKTKKLYSQTHTHRTTGDLRVPLDW